MNLTLNPYICIMLNTVYRLNKWLDNSNYTLLIIVGSMLLANIFLFLTTYIGVGILFYTIVSILSILRLCVHSGKIKFKCVYNVPVIGEKVIIKKGFYWNGAFYKRYPRTDMGSKTWFYTIDKGGEWEVIDIKELDGDWMIYMLDDESTQINIKYFESRKYWETKSDIRNRTLSKLGI